MIELLAALLGLIVGSFLNVCIYRWPRDLSIVRPTRSRCPSCDRQIAWHDNVPVLSFVLLRGRCRYCAQPIHWRYPVVEILTAACFALFVSRYGFSAEAAKFSVFAALLIGLIFSDLDMLILPDEFTIGGLFIGLLFAFFTSTPVSPGMAPESRGSSFLSSALGAFLPALSLWVLGWIFEKIWRKEGLGFGDVKMIAMIGAFLGLYGTLVTVIAGSLGGSVIGLLWIKLMKKDAATYQLPFGTFLGLAALMVALLNFAG